MGYALELDNVAAPMTCKLVRGFDDAIMAAQDPSAPMPARLIIVRPAVELFNWLAQWAVDDEQVRRTVTLRRRADNVAVTAVVTLAAYGHAIETALAVESVTLPSQRRRIVRSGVHPKSFLATILAGHVRANQTVPHDARVVPDPLGEPR